MLPKILAVALCALFLMPTAIGAFPERLNYTPSQWEEIVEEDYEDFAFLTAFPNARISVMNSTGYRFVFFAGINDTLDKSAILYSYSVDGETWSDIEVAYQNSTYNCTFPSAAIDSEDTIHLAFCLGNLTDADIYYTNSSSGDFDEAIFISEDTEGWAEFFPAVAVDENDIAHITWEATNLTHDTSRILYTNSSGFLSIENIRGTKYPDEDTEISYYYPSIAINSSGAYYIAYFWYNSTSEYTRVGCYKDYGGSAVVNDNIGYNQSRNPCIAINSTDEIWITYKRYNTTEDIAEIGVTHFPSPSLALLSHTHTQNYSGANTTLYPSIALSSDDQMLITTTPNGEMDWWKIEDDVVLDNDTYYTNNASHIWLFTNLRWANFYNPTSDAGDLFIFGYSFINESVTIAGLWFTDYVTPEEDDDIPTGGGGGYTPPSDDEEEEERETNETTDSDDNETDGAFGAIGSILLSPIPIIVGGAFILTWILLSAGSAAKASRGKRRKNKRKRKSKRKRTPKRRR